MDVAKTQHVSLLQNHTCVCNAPVVTITRIKCAILDARNSYKSTEPSDTATLCSNLHPQISGSPADGLACLPARRFSDDVPRHQHQPYSEEDGRDPELDWSVCPTFGRCRPAAGSATPKKQVNGSVKTRAGFHWSARPDTKWHFPGRPSTMIPTLRRKTPSEKLESAHESQNAELTNEMANH